MKHITNLLSIVLVALFTLSFSGCSKDESEKDESEVENFLKVKKYWLSGLWVANNSIGIMDEFEIELDGDRLSEVYNATIYYITKDNPGHLYEEKASLCYGFYNNPDSIDDVEADFLSLTFIHNDEYYNLFIYIKSVKYDGRLTIDVKVDRSYPDVPYGMEHIGYVSMEKEKD